MVRLLVRKSTENTKPESRREAQRGNRTRPTRTAFITQKK